MTLASRSNNEIFFLATLLNPNGIHVAIKMISKKVTAFLRGEIKNTSLFEVQTAL